MKLWQRIFLYTLILVMLAVGVTSILLLENSYALAMNQKEQNVYSEHEFLITSFKSMVIAERLRQNEVVLGDSQVKKMMEDTMNENTTSGIIFLNEDMDQIYANRSEQASNQLLETVKDEKKSCMEVKGDRLYTASMENIEARKYYFVTEQDISDVVKIHEDMLSRIQAISMGCAVGIALILLVVVKLLLSPLQKINEGTRAIARGDYKKRIEEKGRDELSELAKNMNQMAEAVEKNVEALKSVADNRKRFIDNLSHEMKTPLTSILGFSDLLQIKKDISEEGRVEYAGIIKEEATRMRTLSGKLMELITVGEANLEWQQEEMQRMLQEIGASLEVVAGSHHISIHCESEEGLLVIDRELFKSLLYNLADNAIKASEEGDLVEISGVFLGEEYVVTVKDQGIGIEQEELKRISEAFYMVDKVRSRASGGAGLGLALCSEIVDIHRGSMEFESEPERGTTVTIRMKGGRPGEAKNTETEKGTGGAEGTV